VSTAPARARRLARLSMAALALASLGGCATSPPTPALSPHRGALYVLLPAQEGKTGALAVTEGGVTRILDAPYAAARVGDDGRLDVGVATEDEVKRVFDGALSALPPRPVSFTLYFLEGRDELTPESRSAVSQIVAEIARHPAPEIALIGHTDRVGGVAFNDRLSLQRAERMRDELVKLGVRADRITVAGRGEREPLVQTDDEVAEPRNRRVEITVR